jgi:hypothetical protein
VRISADRLLPLEQAAIDASCPRDKRGVTPLFDDLTAIEHQFAALPLDCVAGLAIPFPTPRSTDKGCII